MKKDDKFLENSGINSDVTNGLNQASIYERMWWGDTSRMVRRAYRKFWRNRGLETLGRFDPDAIHKVSLRRMIEQNKVVATPEQLEHLKWWCKSTVSLRGGAVKYKNGTAEV